MSNVPMIILTGWIGLEKHGCYTLLPVCKLCAILQLSSIHFSEVEQYQTQNMDRCGPVSRKRRLLQQVELLCPPANSWFCLGKVAVHCSVTLQSSRWIAVYVIHGWLRSARVENQSVANLHFSFFWPTYSKVTTANIFMDNLKTIIY